MQIKSLESYKTILPLFRMFQFQQKVFMLRAEPVETNWKVEEGEDNIIKGKRKWNILCTCGSNISIVAKI